MVDKVYLIGAQPTEGYSRLFRHAFPDAKITCLNESTSRPSVDLNTVMVFVDGPMVGPSTSGYRVATSSIRTIVHDTPRDLLDTTMWEYACRASTYRIGIGRGSLLMWLMYGGTVCEVNNHNHVHDLVDESDHTIALVYSHHSYAVDAGVSSITLARSNNATNVTRINKGTYATTTALASEGRPLYTIEAWRLGRTMGIQWRPDVSGCPVSGVKLFYTLLDDFISKG